MTDRLAALLKAHDALEAAAMEHGRSQRSGDARAVQRSFDQVIKARQAAVAAASRAVERNAALDAMITGEIREHLVTHDGKRLWARVRRMV